MLSRRIFLAAAAAILAGCTTPQPVSSPAPSAAASSAAAFDIEYTISMPDPSTHLYDVQIDLERLAGDTVRLQMPVWSPGRYAKFDFARNVEQFSATADGKPMKWDKENGSLWRLYPAGATSARINYRVFANTLSGSFSVLDTIHANWNGPSVFLYVVDHKPDPVRLHINRPASWHIVNGDTRSVDQADYSFENYDRLADTPTEVSPEFMVDSFMVDSILYRTMVHHNGPVPEGARARFVSDVQKIVRYENSVISPPPIEMYTFLFHIGFPGGDGMEHLYSTQIINRAPWDDSSLVLSGISTASHEYFHTWNVKRIRPAALGPFDYTREQYQPSLWVAEGWTQYYGQVGLHRAGITPLEEFYNVVAQRIIRPNLTAPGRKEVSARMASFHAPFWDGAPPAQAVDRNAFFSYYTKGAGLATVLDLMIRGNSSNTRSLDDALRSLKRISWDQPNASYYLKGRGYTEDDVERAVGEAMGRGIHSWFERYVGGTEDPPFEDALALAGIRLIRDGRDWSLQEMPDATPAQLKVRNGWTTGKTDR